MTRISQVFLVVAFAAASSSAQNILVRNAHLIPVSGPEVDNTDVRIENGRIVEIGTALKATINMPTLDAHGRRVMPAYVLAHTSEGLDRPNEVMDMVPFVSVLDSIDPTRPFFDDCLRDGVYTINIMPGDRTTIGGMGRVLRPHGHVVEEMTVAADSGLKIAIASPGGNRAAHMAKLRATFDDARRLVEKKEREVAETRPSGNVTFDLEKLSIERRKLALVRLLKGEIPAFMSCSDGGDVLRALDLAKEYSLKIRLVLGPATWRAAATIAKAGVPVILGPDFTDEEQDPETGKMHTRILPKILHEAGVTFSVTALPTSLGARYLWYQAGQLVSHGIPRDVALRAVTLEPARALGLDKNKGSIEVGKDGDLLVLTDDPLSGRAWVDTGVSEGRIVYERKTDRRLAEVLGVSTPDRN